MTIEVKHPFCWYSLEHLRIEVLSDIFNDFIMTMLLALLILRGAWTLLGSNLWQSYDIVNEFFLEFVKCRIYICDASFEYLNPLLKVWILVKDNLIKHIWPQKHFIDQIKDVWADDKELRSFILSNHLLITIVMEICVVDNKIYHLKQDNYPDIHVLYRLCFP